MTNSIKKVCLVVDNPLRDLPGCILLSTSLVSMNYKVYLVPHNLVFRNNFSELLGINPDFVVLNYLRKNNDHIAEALIKCKIPFSVLDTEGGVLAHESFF